MDGAQAPVDGEQELRNRLNPLGSLRSPAWWCVAVPFGIAIVVAHQISAQVTLPQPETSPIFLPLGLGVAVLVVWGRSLWPAFALADLVGQLLIGDRPAWLLLLATALHVTTVIVGATLIPRWRALPHSLQGSARYLATVAVLSVLGAITGLIVLVQDGGFGSPGGLIDGVGIWTLGDLGGYLVPGALLLAWYRPGARAELRRRLPLIGCLVLLVNVPVTLISDRFWADAVSLVIATLIAARFGTRWGTVATAIVLAGLMADAVRRDAQFGGATPAAQGVNVMIAVALLAGAALVLGGYHDAVGPSSTSRRVVALMLAAMMVVAGLSSFLANAITIDHPLPLTIACLLALSATVTLSLVRIARPPTRVSTRRGLALAALAGLCNGANLGLYLASVPRAGSAAATALAMTAPAIIVVIVALRDRHLPRTSVIAGVIVIVAGPVIMLSTSAGATSSGLALALGSAVGFALFVLLLAVALSSADVIDVAIVASAVACSVTGALALLTLGASAFDLTSVIVGTLVIGAVGAWTVPLLTRAWALPRIGAAQVGAIGVLGPAVTALVSFKVFGVGNLLQVVALLVIGAGAIVATLGRARAT
ncbi:MAG: MASE1 domain-containing protein [Gaiellales bacterium]